MYVPCVLSAIVVVLNLLVRGIERFGCFKDQTRPVIRLLLSERYSHQEACCSGDRSYAAVDYIARGQGCSRRYVDS